MQTISTVILAYDGMRIYDFAVAQEVFGNRPEMTAVAFDLGVFAATDEVRTAEGVVVPRSIDLDDHKADIVVVPGSEQRLGKIAPAELEWLRRQAKAPEAAIIGLCTGAFVLAEAGLLGSRRATTHWRFMDQLVFSAPGITPVTNALYVRDGNVWTSAGVTAGVDVLLAAIEAIAGSSTAQVIARSMVTPPRRQGSQAQFAPRSRPVPVHPFAGLADFIQEDPARAWTVGDLARACNMSPRTFHRRFKDVMGLTPVRWVTALRLQEARSLLETTSLTIEAVSHQVGYSTADHFRQHFSSHFRLSPSAYRASMRHAPRVGPR
ncbi:GlxA family transcriptional regulator [Zhihengliuella salsuginis]|uniref:Transcriptional regulator FtrA n=1 Tax=Zhihengliuella salsuginis TaxID=578222 RepID=A0ABQ3GIW0_9MICC|nr:helix-turn-helix domain-containing protein [Zhihengliuella salsuginis]GHD05610.1 transcriptional regulator FtrA [Zhihengliuella salsuginis]